MHDLDLKILSKLPILEFYTRQNCLEFKEKNDEKELEKSKNNCENNGKNGLNELNRFIALTNIFKPLCRYKGIAVILLYYFFKI